MKNREVESLKEAIALIVAHDACSSQSCDTCPMNADRNGNPGNGECGGNKRRVDKFWKKRFGVNYFNGRPKDSARAAYDFIMGSDLDKEKPKEKPKAGTCATCLFSQMHPSGIRFCKSWHNFTHNNGFCYRYDDGKIEDKPPVDK